MHLPRIEFSSAAKTKVGAAVLGWFQEEAPTEKAAEKGKPRQPVFVGKSNKEIESLLGQLRESKHFSGKKGEISVLRFFPFSGFPNLVLLGLGAEKKWTSEMARQAGGALLLAQKRERLPNLIVQADSIFGRVAKGELSYFVQAFCEGYLLAGYEYKDLKKEEKDAFRPEVLELTGPKMESQSEAGERARVLAEAVIFARSLGDRPANVLTPTEMANLAEKMAKEHGLRCTVWGKPQIEKEKMGLLLGVAKGSSEEPKFIILEHRGGKKGDKPVALVGKGITFDSGGISLKPAARMEDMKYDMMGAATVIGTMQAAADLKLPVNIIGLVATTENMPGGRAQKPGDIARSSNGKTVEIINTDAEGRLILADTLEYAQKQEPQAIVDFATLTGAVVDALGTVTTGIMGNHAGLIQRIKQASEVTAERVWELPLYEEYEEDLKSTIADYKNSGIREAGASKGGTFLKFFVDPKFPWVHCDIAGTAYHRKDVNYHPTKYGAGVMVRLLVEMLENWKPLK